LNFGSSKKSLKRVGGGLAFLSYKARKRKEKERKETNSFWFLQAKIECVKAAYFIAAIVTQVKMTAFKLVHKLRLV
jgi:hypothetical protein